MYMLIKRGLKNLLGLFMAITLIVVFYKLNKYPIQLKSTQRESGTKYILYWTSFWKFKDYKIGFGAEPFETCEYKNCFATNNRTLKPVEEFEAIIFHASIYNPKTAGKPDRRNERQVYIYSNIEAPAYLSPNYAQFNSFYNWTMTYRFDSDIVHRHDKFTEEESNYELPSMKVVHNKTKLIAWFASHCETSSRRERLVAEIQKFLPVDIYGSCGPLKCEKLKGDTKLSSPECYDMIEENYKFYLSFENSICKDYSTEKLYNALKKNIVPIVYGAGDYSLSAPPHSVINVNDFVSVKELTDYLKYLDKNANVYLTYFEWKKKYKIVKSSHACDICKKLNQPLVKSVYHDLRSWSRGKSDEICKNGQNFPMIVKNIL
ncbi:hypothetical protein RI129_004861 [Pyrocoelia pectoralis]|uniref:Fucosyltransferase n=1 Tax=Pyrocoelia pectoralis TaxID=417401 RepID=A0AAN7ZJS9_9COLE